MNVEIDPVLCRFLLFFAKYIRSISQRCCWLVTRNDLLKTARHDDIRVPIPLALEDVEEADWNSTNQDEYWCDKLYLEVRDVKGVRDGNGTEKVPGAIHLAATSHA